MRYLVTTNTHRRGGGGGAFPVFGSQESSTNFFIGFAESRHNRAVRETTRCMLLAAQTRRDSARKVKRKVADVHRPVG